ncbi:SH3 domain-binding protein 5 homolog isoform X2 [Cimex lectularius]|uniref:SH3 domain-binding protein 5 homolog n=1 Tax=Cimex lectularius TaxID=79782 RepID=A0A8I6TJ75_CIMLE|nr:SH3 domain-binding protein 5 homolog isoform X2 [Cimex lectularius]
MESLKTDSQKLEDDDDLDPRIQIELEQLNNCTDQINKLEIELDEANTTFNILLNDSTRRLKVMTCKLGSCIERARPYYESVEIARKARVECQRAAVEFQRANEIHQAAKETVALAEDRFLSKQHEWTFDNAWQEMLNHATTKVTEAEYNRAEKGREHQKRATLFNMAEQRVLNLEGKLKRSIIKSKPYFVEKEVCQGQLDAQKRRIDQVQAEIAKAKSDYSASLRRLELISEEIHSRRKDKSGSVSPSPVGPREPGVGAELECEEKKKIPCIKKDIHLERKEDADCDGAVGSCWDIEQEMERADLRSLGSLSMATSSAISDNEELDIEPLEEKGRIQTIVKPEFGKGIEHQLNTLVL